MEALPAHDVYDNVANPGWDMDNGSRYISLSNNERWARMQPKDDNYESEDDCGELISVPHYGLQPPAARRTCFEVKERPSDRVPWSTMDNAEPGQEGWKLFDLSPTDYEMSFSDISFVPG